MKSFRLQLRLILAVGCFAAAGAAYSYPLYRAQLLHPVAAYNSEAGGMSGSNQIGTVEELQYQPHAVIWNGSSNSYVDLHPAAFGYSRGLDVDADWQVGVGTNPVTPFWDEHAILWNGSAESFIDLHPQDEEYIGEYSFALAISGASQVGYVTTQRHNDEEAFLWHGTAESAVSLHPGYAIFGKTRAVGVHGDSQVGYGTRYHADIHSYRTRALLWEGTAESMIDLQPEGYLQSQALDVWGDFQVGSAGSTELHTPHAVLWSGSAESMADLHPNGFFTSEATAITGEFQAGNGLIESTPGVLGATHAIVWKGSAESAVDLHQFLEPLNLPTDESFAMNVNSYAADVDKDGVVFGTVLTFGYSSYRSYAVMWVPIPEPSAILLVLSCLPLTLRRSLSSRR